MIRKPWKSLRFKMLYLFGLSAFGAFMSSGLLYLVAVAAYSADMIYLSPLLREVLDKFGLLTTFISVTVIFFFIYFFALSRSTIRYLVRISQGIERIAGGDFESRLPVRGGDELGALAENINKMTAQLKLSIEEERRTERTKAELVTNVSHDLRTPLTSIVGYLGLIEEDRYRDEVELRHYVQIAYEKSIRLKTMIDDLFEYTRTSGGIGLRLSPINLVEMIGQLSAQFRLQFEQAEMKCRLTLPDHPILIDADGDKLVRVFENLIVNAIQYGKEGRQIDIAVRSERWLAVVEIANYGEPLPASVIPLLFERFYRGEQSRSRNTGGSGLGLAIAKNIVELHHGLISAASAEGKTSFKVELPLGGKDLLDIHRGAGKH
ncbi:MULTISPECIES: HAMP domain-containing sensor histidine kinase [unclassified Paenibacillus]|uniref:sensor histidine kinase n=1 Tax=unclassified Paenibacillus TaxID=185978 RepID=UPI0010529875|nr:MULTISPECIES: HAMP domain-containing sensor histidine kinase [unclassified Paenibacillus]NIK70473.1 signal transduction histidine kinase [Paenibacillus sp. BK720]TCM90970.1 HAMP domain-containing protein [Paenibacillus sp. BK033]